MTPGPCGRRPPRHRRMVRPNAARSTSSATVLEGQVQTLFRGETLRGLLLTSYGFSIFGDKAMLASWVCLIAAFVLLLASAAGFVHAFRTSKDEAFAPVETSVSNQCPQPSDLSDPRDRGAAARRPLVSRVGRCARPPRPRGGRRSLSPAGDLRLFRRDRHQTQSGRVEPLLIARDVRKLYRSTGGEVIALDGVDLSVARGELVAVMGPSGSGKTTMLNCLSGLDDIDGGHVLVEGRDLFAMSDAERTPHRAHAMGFIFQAFNLIPVFNAVENVELPLLLAAREAESVARHAHWTCSSESDSATAPTIARTRCPAASSNTSPSPAPSSVGPRSCGPTNRPATSTAPWPARHGSPPPAERGAAADDRPGDPRCSRSARPPAGSCGCGTAASWATSTDGRRRRRW